MNPSLLSILKCPECKGSFTLDPPSSDSDSTEQSVAEGKLTCSNSHSYPIIGGIPRFVPDDQYVSSFSFEWNFFSKTQLDDVELPKDTDDLEGREAYVKYQSYITRKGRESHDTFYHKTGFSPEDLKGKLVLDAGCGMGRFSEVASEAGAEVVACDLSLAVEACYRNLGHRSNVHVVQADIFRLPFGFESFDIIYSLGVLHHTPDTRKAFLSLPPLLKSGGEMAIWVYDKQSWSRCIIPPYHFMSDLYRRWTSRWSPDCLLRFSRLRARLHPLVRIPRIGSFFDLLWPGSVHPEYEWRVLDTFDWYSPTYQWKHTRDEVEEWFKESGMTEVTQLPFLVSVSGVKK